MTRFGGEVVPKNFPRKPDVKVKTIRSVDYYELDTLCQEAFGLTGRYQSLIADMEWHNDSQYQIYIVPWDSEELTLKELIDSEFGDGTFDNLIRLRGGVKVDKLPSTMAMLTYGAGVGWLEPGEYTVEVYY